MRPLIRAALLGTGNIGSDLGLKLAQDPEFHLSAVAGRRSTSPGFRRLADISEFATDRGLEGILDSQVDFDVIFDATSADSHRANWSLLHALDRYAVDLTPSRIGTPTVPGILGASSKNLSMITCGGQASVPLVAAISKSCSSVAYVEVSSSIASRSAGPATRINLDDYIAATQDAAKLASGAEAAKAILILNPVEPPTLMRTTVQMEVSDLDKNMMMEELNDVLCKVQSYVPGYEFAYEPLVEGNLVSVTVKVTGAGDFLPTWAGNLDIITAAAVRTARDVVLGEAA